MTAMATSTIIRVTIKATGEQHYFSSMAAIYEHLTYDQLGIRLPSLWQVGLPYSNKRCSIERVNLYSKPQTKK